jgi:hypothetical protein
MADASPNDFSHLFKDDYSKIYDDKLKTDNQEQLLTPIMTFDEHVKHYIVYNNPLLYILTPCYGAVCNVGYVSCLMKTIKLFKEYNFPLEVLFCPNDSLITRARNNLIAKALSNINTTHVIFIDADITWNELDVLKLVLANKPLIGGVYPLKKYNWDKLIVNPKYSQSSNIVQSMLNNYDSSIMQNTISHEEVVQSLILNYNLNYLDSTLHIDNNIAKVKHIATGFMMIQRKLLSQMIIKYSNTKYTDDTGFLEKNENDYAYALFNCNVVNNHYLSEDWYFCEQWVKMGGDVFIDVSIALTHTGTSDFKGNFLNSIL